MEYWTDIFSYFWWDTPIGIIASCVIIALSVYLALYITYELIQLGYWLSVQSIKAAWIGMAIMFYTLFFVFLFLPLDAVNPNRRIADTFSVFAKNIQQTLYNYYPKLEKKIKRTSKKCCKKSKSLLPYEAPELSPKARRIANGEVHLGRDEELTSSTEILFQSPRKAKHAVQYHCSKCGTEFTAVMAALLRTKHEAFCEKCGQKFVSEGQIPVPAEN